jgi:nicotinate-nucleotide pyrophosphorylase (carboxylating)
MTLSLPPNLSTRVQTAGLDPAAVESLVRAALAEDLAGGVDVTTTATIPPNQRATAAVIARADGVVAGLAIVEVVFHCAAHGDMDVTPYVVDGAHVERGTTLMSVTGATADLLVAERTALNFMCHLSGIATLTAAWVDAIRGTRATIRDTRKTLPVLRAVEKYAVRCGGGRNHRMSLADAALVKDNHVAAAGGVAAAYRMVKKRFPDIAVEVEVDDVAGAVAAVEAGADLVLLDNFSVDELRQAVEKVGARAQLEASGGLSLDRAYDVAATGVDYLAVGALTHSAPALDIAMEVREVFG